MHEPKSAKFAAKREPPHTRLRWSRAIFFPSSCGSSAMTTRPDLAVDRCIEGGGYAVRRPRRGPSDDEVRMLINMQQAEFWTTPLSPSTRSRAARRFGRHISDRKKLVAGSLINMVYSPVFGDEARGGKSTELPSVRRRRAEWYQYRRSASS